MTEEIVIRTERDAWEAYHRFHLEPVRKLCREKYPDPAEADRCVEKTASPFHFWCLRIPECREIFAR